MSNLLLLLFFISDLLGASKEIFKIIGAIISGAVVAWLTLWLNELKKNQKKSLLEPYKQDNEPSFFIVEQVNIREPGTKNTLYVGRLKLINSSKHVAQKVEIFVTGVEDNGRIRSNFIPAPLRWTHRTKEPRDIFPQQVVMVDILEFIASHPRREPIVLALPNLEGISKMRDIREGQTKLLLTSYQENGQVHQFVVLIEWSGKEITEAPPKIISFEVCN